MPDNPLDSKLDQLLEYREEPVEDEFVLDVMHAVGRQRRLRKMILATFGLVGAAFGLVGALMLSDSITQVFSNLPAMGIMQTVLLLCGVAAFYTWFMNDDLSLPS